LSILNQVFCIYKPGSKGILTLWIVLAAMLFSGCSSAPKAPSDTIASTRIISHSQSVESKPTLIEIAEGLKGKPYRYGGVTPKGFDCSGFVHYTYGKAGLSIPRTTGEQYRMAQRLSLDEARPGDLLFFRINSRKLRHVGLYVGNGRFIHASTSRKQVAEASLDEPYWRKRLLGAGRIQ
jgi:cell wall-associated NlpC family hydrolase